MGVNTKKVHRNALFLFTPIFWEFFVVLLQSKSGIACHGHKTTRQLKYDVAKKRHIYVR